MTRRTARRAPVFGAFGAALFVTFAFFVAAAQPAGAVFTSNTVGCEGSAVLTAKDGTVYNANATDSLIKVPRDGGVAYQGSITTVTHDHAGEIDMEIAMFKVPLGTWGPRHNGSDTSTAAGVKDIPSAFAQVPPGKYRISGFHRGNEGGCAGWADIEIAEAPWVAGRHRCRRLDLGECARAGRVGIRVIEEGGTMKFRGRPVLGAFAGLFFGVFVGVDLVLFKVLATNSILVLVLPVVGLVLGLVLGLTAPLGRGRVKKRAAAPRALNPPSNRLSSQSVSMRTNVRARHRPGRFPVWVWLRGPRCHERLLGGAPSVITTPVTDPLPNGLAALAGELRALVAEFEPDVVVVERVFFQTNVRTAMSVGQASGLALVAAVDGGCDVVQYTSNEVKQAVAGYGAAPKEQIQRMVQSLLSLLRGPNRPTRPTRWRWRSVTMLSPRSWPASQKPHSDDRIVARHPARPGAIGRGPRRGRRRRLPGAGADKCPPATRRARKPRLPPHPHPCSGRRDRALWLCDARRARLLRGADRNARCWAGCRARDPVGPLTVGAPARGCNGRCRRAHTCSRHRPEDRGATAPRVEGAIEPGRQRHRSGRRQRHEWRPPRRDVRAALSSLGYGVDEVREAVRQLPDDGSVEDLLRLALRQLAAAR